MSDPSAFPSYWHTTFPRTSVVPSPLPTTADVVVVGGGVMGTALALCLARAGVRPVLIEQANLANGATGRNGGLLVVGTAESYPAAITRLGYQAAHDVWALTLENQRLFAEIITEEAIDCHYHEHGHLNLAISSVQLDHYRQNAEMLHADGFPAQLLSREDVQTLITTPLGESIVGGFLMPRSGRLHSTRLVVGLAMAAQRYGACICLHTPVQRFEEHGDAVIVHTAHGQITTRHVVVAVNAWSGELFPQLASQIVPVRGQVLSYAPLPPTFTTGCGVGLSSTGEYWQQTESGRIVIGGWRELAPNRDVGVREFSTTSEVQQAIETIFPTLFPQLEPLTVEQRWSGPMAFTRDYLPIVDRAPNYEHVWMMGGFSGHGMPFAIILGRMLTEMIMTDEVPTALRHFAHRV